MRTKLYFSLTALILVALGVICVLNPLRTFQSVAWLIGVLILALVVVTFLFAPRKESSLPNVSATMQLSVFQIIVSAIFMLNSWVGESALIVVFAMWLMNEGISVIFGAVDYRRVGYQQWWLMLIFGVLSVGLSFFAICHPDATAVAITSLLGISLISLGAVRLAAFPAVSRMQRQLKEERRAAENAKNAK
ncbi:MAG: DUF308 domain-containing protein [Bacteroidales bacterium]|nr:DUF308 domain-containing protein [Bacteroidales bacterium]